MARRTSGRVSAFRRTPLFAAVACVFAQGAVAATYVVNTSSDFGVGSLRDAIFQANTNCATDTAPLIQFQGGPFTISPSMPLPALQCLTNAFSPSLDATIAYGAAPNTDATGFNATFGVTLNGSTNFYGGTCAIDYIDNGYGGQLGVTGMEIINFNYGSSGYGLCGNVYARGNRLVNNATGMYIRSGSRVGGSATADRNVIVGATPYDGYGIEIKDGNITIANNFIGTPDGKSENLNYEGIVFTGCCTSPTGWIQDNVIASSGYANIDIGFDTLSIYRNKIGVDVNGTALLGSATYGISLYYSYGATISQNVIGGATNGIDIWKSNSVDIIDNRIGVTADGSMALGNNIGIYDDSSTFTRIYGNSISGNSSFGVWLTGVTDASVDANFIGTNYGGTLRVPNGTGVYLGAAATASFSGNTISGNWGAGFWSSDASGISLSGNFIGTATGGGSALSNQGEGVVAECGTGLSLSGNNISYNYGAGLSLSGIQSSSFSGNTINSNGYFEVSANGVEMGTSTCYGGPPLSRLARAKSIVPNSPNRSDSNNFYGNTITGHRRNGVSVVGGNNNVFDSNDVRSNRQDGIRIDSEFVNAVIDSPATGNRITKGSNYGNGSKNIELGNGNPNNRQARPVIRSAIRDTKLGTTTVTVDLTTNSGEYILELFSNAAPGMPAGQNYLATSLDLNQASAGMLTYAFTLNETASDNFSATAIHQDTADTSEFADLVSASVVAVPAADVLPTSIDFGDVVVGRQSSQGTISITSQGTAPYVINQLRDGICDTSAIICTSGSFICSTNCSEGTPYSRGASCTITASFAPTAQGPQTKTLALCDNTTLSPRTLNFFGNGITAPQVDIAMAPTSYYFGEVLVGAQSPSKTFTVTNMGTQPVYLGNAKVTPPDFVIAGGTCGSTLAAGASCATDVSFLPSGKGVVFGSLEVTGSNAPLAAKAKRSKVTTATNTIAATLQGSGVQFGDLRLPASIAFGTRVLHSTPTRQTVTINNTGNGTLSISSISVAGPFTLGNPCPATLASGASCTITLDFNPATLGTFNGTLTIVSDAPGGNRSIPITAQVIADARPVVTVAPTIVGFGARIVGTESPARRVTITNEGAQTAALGAFAFVQPLEGATEFSVAGTNCTGTLAPQATCFADIVFKALGFGERNGRFVVPSNSPDTPQSVTLGGTGCRPFTAGSNRSGRDPCAP